MLTCESPFEDTRLILPPPIRRVHATGLEEINGGLLEAGFWTASLRVHPGHNFRCARDSGARKRQVDIPSRKNLLSFPCHCGPAQVKNQRRNLIGRSRYEFDLCVHGTRKELWVTVDLSFIRELQRRLPRC